MTISPYDNLPIGNNEKAPDVEAEAEVVSYVEVDLDAETPESEIDTKVPKSEAAAAETPKAV